MKSKLTAPLSILLLIVTLASFTKANHSKQANLKVLTSWHYAGQFNLNSTTYFVYVDNTDSTQVAAGKYSFSGTTSYYATGTYDHDTHSVTDFQMLTSGGWDPSPAYSGGLTW